MTEETPASVPTTPPSSWQEQGGYAACALAILGVGGVAGYHRQRRLEQEELENAARSKKRPRKVGGSGRQQSRRRGATALEHVARELGGDLGRGGHGP